MDFLSLLVSLTVNSAVSPLTLHQVIPYESIYLSVHRPQEKISQPELLDHEFHEQVKKDFPRSEIFISQNNHIIWQYPEIGNNHSKKMLKSMFNEIEHQFSSWPSFQNLSSHQKWNFIHQLLVFRTQIFDFDVLSHLLKMSQKQLKETYFPCFSNGKVRIDFIFKKNKALFQTQYIMSVGDGNTEFPPVGKAVGKLKIKRWMEISEENLTLPQREEIFIVHMK